MTQIIVASHNPVKVQSALDGFRRMFPDQTFSVDGVSVPSGVSDQPMSDGETRRGAANRARNARDARPDADYWVGIEGGVAAADGSLQVFAWVVVMDAEGRTGHSRTGMFYLPDEVVALVNQGHELGDADDIVFGRANSKQQNGAIGILTGDAIDRTAYYADAVVLALVPFKNPSLTFKLESRNTSSD
jgi:inosine/xanthosine triphosphatase